METRAFILCRKLYNDLDRGTDNVSQIFSERMFGSMGIKKERERLLTMMSTMDPCSTEYGKLANELEKLTRGELNQNGWKGQLFCGLLQTGISSACSIVNTWTVLKHERRGNVVTTKSLNFGPKPTEHPNNYSIKSGK